MNAVQSADVAEPGKVEPYDVGEQVAVGKESVHCVVGRGGVGGGAFVPHGPVHGSVFVAHTVEYPSRCMDATAARRHARIPEVGFMAE